MARTRYIRKTDGTGQVAGSIGSGRSSVPVAASVATAAGTTAPAPPADLTRAVAELAKDRPTPEEKLARAESRLLDAIESMSTEEGFKAALDFAASVPGYSFGNTTMLMWEHFVRRLSSPDTVPANPGVFMSFNRWKEHGRSVVKGATGYPLLAPKTVKSRWYVDGSGKRAYLKRGDKAPAGKDEQNGQAVTGFTVVYTFPEYLTDGEPLPSLPKPQLLEGETLTGLDEVVAGLVVDQGFTLHWVDRADDPVLAAGANGYTSYSTRRIVVCADLPSDFARSKTLLHEYGHMVMHGQDGEARSECSGIKEVQAEAAAYLTFQTLADMDTSDYSVPYTAGWLGSVSNDPDKRLREAQRAINAMGKVAAAVVDAYNAKHGTVPAQDLVAAAA
jgi:hypothetical protein